MTLIAAIIDACRDIGITTVTSHNPNVLYIFPTNPAKNYHLLAYLDADHNLRIELSQGNYKIYDLSDPKVFEKMKTLVDSL